MAGDATLTRYLCAGAYLDLDYAQAVVDELVADPSRGVAPAPGVDVPAVVRHSLAAVRASMQRDAGLTLVLLLAAVGTGLRGLILVAWLSSLVLLAWAARNLFHREAARAVAQILAFILLSAVFAVVLLVLHERSRREFAGPAGWSGWLPIDVSTLALLVALLWIVTFLARIARFAALGEQLAAGRFDPDAAPREAAHERDRLAYLADARGSALAVYSVPAPDAPFVGLGPVVHAWTAATRLAPRATLAVADVYAALRPALQALTTEWGRGDVVDLVVAPGSLPPGHPFLVGSPARPVPQLPPTVVAEIAAHAGRNETGYLAVHLDTRDGRGGLAGLVHVRAQDDTLSVDVAVTALPPINPTFRDVDAMPPAGAGVLLRTLGAALVDVFRLAFRAPGQLARSLARALVRRAALTAKPGNAAARSDVGARRGLRELAGAGGEAAAAGFEVTRGVNLVGRTVADAIAGALAAHGLDPQEFIRSADQVRPMTMTGERS